MRSRYSFGATELHRSDDLAARNASGTKLRLLVNWCLQLRCERVHHDAQTQSHTTHVIAIEAESIVTVPVRGGPDAVGKEASAC